MHHRYLFSSISYRTPDNVASQVFGCSRFLMNGDHLGQEASTNQQVSFRQTAQKAYKEGPSPYKDAPSYACSGPPHGASPKKAQAPCPSQTHARRSIGAFGPARGQTTGHASPLCALGPDYWYGCRLWRAGYAFVAAQRAQVCRQPAYLVQKKYSVSWRFGLQPAGACTYFWQPKAVYCSGPIRLHRARLLHEV